MSLYKHKESLHLPWGPHPQPPNTKLEIMTLAKGSPVVVLVRHHSCTHKAEENKRPRCSLPLHPLSFPLWSWLWVGSSQEQCLQTLLAGAHKRLKQLSKSPSAALWAKSSCPRICGVVLMLVQLDIGLQRGKVVKTWGWLVRKEGLFLPAKSKRGLNLGWTAAAGLPRAVMRPWCPSLKCWQPGHAVLHHSSLPM